MATKAELQQQVETLRLELHLVQQELLALRSDKAQAVSDEIPWDTTPTPVLSFKARCAAAKAQAMASGRVVRI